MDACCASAAAWLRPALVALVVFACPLAVQAQADHDGELDRWVPSIALEVGGFGHSGKGNVFGGPLDTSRRTPDIRPPPTDGPTQVVDDDRSREDVISALVGGNFELMTPKLADGFGKPRLFMDVSILAALTNEVGMARNGDVEEMRFPDDLGSTALVGENVIVGIGNIVSAQHQGPQIRAGLGAAFTYDFGTERVRLKPSVMYARVPLDVSAKANRAVRLANNPGPVFERDFRLIELQDSQSEVYHGIGPALEIEYETGDRLGPFLMTLFIEGSATYLFGDMRTRLQQFNSDPLSPEEFVRWTYTQDRWMWGATTGLRFRWVPKSQR